MPEWSFGSGRLILRQGDIAQAETEAVVNAANAALAGGGGVDGAIHRAAGREALQTACRAIVAERGPLAPGEAVLTPGFGLKARHILHAVGPIWRGGNRNEPMLLRRAYCSCLALAREHGLASLAFPALSCGAYGYPVEMAAPVALEALHQGLLDEDAAHVELVLFSREALDLWSDLARRIFA